MSLKKATQVLARGTCLGCAGFLGLGSAAYAQDNTGTGTTEDNATIVVTGSTRSAQDVQDVPIAITAFGQEQLEQHSIFEARDLAHHVPGLVVSEEAVGAITFAIRGISLSAENFAVDNAVGYYQNEIFIARSNDFAGSYFDIQSVEVLRGPQSIYFGRNTPTGAILVETARPSSDLEGYAQVTLGGGGGGLGRGADRFFYRTEAAVNLPLADGLAVRVAGFYHNDDGFAESLTTGYQNFSRDDFGVRGTIELSSQDFTATAIFEHTEFDRGSPLFIALGVRGQADPRNPQTAQLNASLQAQIADGIDPFFNFSEFTSADQNTGRSTSATLILDWDINDNWGVRSISGWRDIRQNTVTDLDGTAVASNTTVNAILQEQISTELLVSGSIGDRVHLLVGGIYFRETGSDENLLPFQRLSPTLPAPLLLRGEDIEYVSKAVFANLSIEVTDTLTLSGGIRFSDESKYVFTNSRFTTLPIALAVGPESFDDSVTLYEGRIDWEPNENLLIYGKYGTGYRAGGIGFRAASAQFLPETSSTWEVGLKSEFEIGNTPVRANLALFTQEYQNFQVPVVLANPTRQTIINAGTANITGMELELLVEPVENFTVSAALAVIASGYSSFAFNSLSLGGDVDLSNNNLRDAPDQTLTLSANYGIPTDYGEWSFQVDYAFQTGSSSDTVFQSGAPGLAQTDLFERNGFGTLNARVTLADIGNNSFTLSAWARNITDTTGLTYTLFSSNIYKGSYREPRSFGFDIRYAF